MAKQSITNYCVLITVHFQVKVSTSWFICLKDKYRRTQEPDIHVKSVFGQIKWVNHFLWTLEVFHFVDKS